MARQPKKAWHDGKSEPLGQLEAECQAIIVKHRGENYGPSGFDRATERVNAAILTAGVGILRPVWGDLAAEMANNARNLWWEFMTKPGGGFDKYDGIRPFVPYGLMTLKRICLGRENLRDQFHRRIKTRAPKNEKCNPNNGAAKADRRQVPLEYDPVDHRSTSRALRQQSLAETVRELLSILPEDQREVLILLHLDGANLSAVARERGITARTLHMRAHKARETLRRQYPGFKW